MSEKAREQCNRETNGKHWAHCCICNGRMHTPECTSKRDRNKDCCEERHKMLWNAGQKVGIGDDSQPMLPY
jgi:hypothetical protein